MAHRLNPVLSLALLMIGATWVAAQGGGGTPQPQPVGGDKVFPYELVNYTQAGHEYRMRNSDAIILGRVMSVDLPEGADNTYMTFILSVEDVLHADNPKLEQREKVHVHCTQPPPPYDPIEPGLRCLLLLNRDPRYPGSLHLLTEMQYYPIDGLGRVVKFLKPVPTSDPPQPRRIQLATFIKEIRNLVRRISIEEQALDCEAIISGVVQSAEQGKGEMADFIVVRLEPEKVFKGKVDKGIVTIIQHANPYKWTLRSLNRPAFRAGDRVLVFANKDPTKSAVSPLNPEGEGHWVLPYERQSYLSLSRRNAWRHGVRPMPIEELYEKLERLTAPKSDKAP